MQVGPLYTIRIHVHINYTEEIAITKHCSHTGKQAHTNECTHTDDTHMHIHTGNIYRTKLSKRIHVCKQVYARVLVHYCIGTLGNILHLFQ